MADRITDAVFAPLQPLVPSREFSVDSSNLSTVYANFVRLTGTPEELVLDFGLNTQWIPVPDDPIKLAHRLVLDYYTAKRLLGTLHWAVEQHESVYGVLETDIQNRIQQLRS
jgi:hypothetical protein